MIKQLPTHTHTHTQGKNAWTQLHSMCNMHTRACTHAHTRPYTHVHTYMSIIKVLPTRTRRAHTQGKDQWIQLHSASACIHTHTHARARTHTHMHIHTHTHMDTHTHTHRQTPTCRSTSSAPPAINPTCSMVYSLSLQRACLAVD